MSDIAERVTKIIAKQLKIAPADITPDKSIFDLGADDLDKLELIVAYEEEFGIEISDDESEFLDNVAAIVRLIEGGAKVSS